MSSPEANVLPAFAARSKQRRVVLRRGSVVAPGHEHQAVSAGAGRFARLFIGSTSGWVDHGGAPTVEDVAAHWAVINDENGYSVPGDLMAWSAEFLSHRSPP